MKLLLISTILGAAISENEISFSCMFDPRETLTEGARTKTGNGINTNEVFLWKKAGGDPIVPYYFDDGVTGKDRMVIKGQMKLIEDKTCIKYEETTYQDAPPHRLKILVNQSTCSPREYSIRFQGYVKHNGGEEVLLHSYHQLTDKETCELEGFAKWIRGDILHELMHTLGAIHTQKRPDRDDYIIVNHECIQLGAEDQYSKVGYNTLSIEIPYKCNSIMHYENSTFSIGHGCPTMTPRPDNTDCRQMGNYEPIYEDWDMLNKYHCNDETTDNTDTTDNPKHSTQGSCDYEDDMAMCSLFKSLCFDDISIQQKCKATCNC
eukprot:GFUD01020762.1.p1 GENE.GFUD01020762.1~~GFUD01020762.1.p1  ORF type:complete len:320 (-),score=47.81 GFUD01020762.1:727-1686(-)